MMMTQTDTTNHTPAEFPTFAQLEAAAASAASGKRTPVPPAESAPSDSLPILRRPLLLAVGLLCGGGLLAGGVLLGMLLGRQQAMAAMGEDDSALRQRAIDHLIAETEAQAESMLESTMEAKTESEMESHFAIETLDRRGDVVAITGIERCTDGDFHVGRFWIELRREGDQWQAMTVQRKKARGNALRQAFDWP